MSSSQGDAKLFARVCPSQNFLSNSKTILHNLLVPVEGLSIPFKSSGCRRLRWAITIFDLQLPPQRYHGRLPRLPPDI
jgi:hypothetical protein